ncbi:MAG: hypothetical protein HKN25_08855 [Pyrinomonadaceae bacterium]|nr:hypothetical protein [Pyrinomonadaceae bacterium]
MNRSSLFFIVVFILAVAFAVPAQNRITRTWEVMRYDITAALPQNFTADRDLDVTAKLDVKNVSQRPYSRVTLRISDQAEVSAVKVNGSEADHRKGQERIGGGNNLQRIVVSVPTIAPGSTSSITVNYRLKVKSNSGLNSLSPVGSQFLPTSFWYPTPNSWFFAAGSDFAPYRLKLNSVGALSAISSGTAAGNAFDQNLNGQPFFTVGKWKKFESSGVTVFAPNGSGAGEQARANEIAVLVSEAKAYFAGLFGDQPSYPLRVVSVARGAGFSDGGTFFIDENVFRREKLDSQTAVSLIEGTAKIFLGNSVKTNGDGYGVIREGLSRYVATQFLEKKYGKDIADIERLQQRTNYSAIAGRDAPLYFVSPLDGYYYNVSANKGAMIWKFLERNSGQNFYSKIKEQAQDGTLTMDELRAAFSEEKAYLDYMLDKTSEMNLMVGVPSRQGSQTTVALRNASDVLVSVEVVATAENGEKLKTRVSIPENGFGQASFNTPLRIVSAQVDAENVYPQTNYIDDIAPGEIGDNDPLLFIKREFDRQRYSDAESNARKVLKIYPRLVDAQTFLARALLAQQKITEAQRIYQAIKSEKLPTARSLAWANAGLGEIAIRTGRKTEALTFLERAILSGGDYGAALAARTAREKLGSGNRSDAAIAGFFSKFDAAVGANNKSAIDSLVVPGEVATFASSVAGQAQEWSTRILQIDSVNAETALVETDMTVRLLNRQSESGKAVYKLSMVAGTWKLSGVEIFEVR